MKKAFKIIFELSEKYNNPIYFEEDPVKFPRHFFELYKQNRATLQDIEISALLCAHLAWGRRAMIVRDCNRLMDEIKWSPYEYIMSGNYRSDSASLHRTVKWSEIAFICGNLKKFYDKNQSLELLNVTRIREQIFGRKPDPKAANKKIHMFRRWMVRCDNIVDLGVWKSVKPSELIIPLDVHVHRSALEMGLTSRKSADITTAIEITDYLKQIFPDDPCKGDFALFALPASGSPK
ncbi:MAG: DUF2400 domain-containing protein [Bacteroidales bacterium]